MAANDAGAPSGAPARVRWAGFDDEEGVALAIALTMAQIALGTHEPDVSELLDDLSAELTTELRTRPPTATAGGPSSSLVEAHVDPRLGERLSAYLGPVAPLGGVGPSEPPTMTKAGPEGTGPRPFGPGERMPDAGQHERPPFPPSALDGFLAGIVLRRGARFDQGPVLFAHLMDEAANDLAGLALDPALTWEHAARALAARLVDLFGDAHGRLELAARRVVERAEWCNRSSSGLVPGLEPPDELGGERC